MIPDYSKIIRCPYCGEKKELLSLQSGNSIGARTWSDAKQIAPMLPRVSPVQKCSHCGKYFWEYKQNGEQEDNGQIYTIGFIYENVAGKRPMSTYAMTVDEVEEITGIDFFPSLPDKIEKRVEAEVDFTKWTVKL